VSAPAETRVSTRRRAAGSSGRRTEARLTLLNSFALLRGGRVLPLPPSAQRVVAFIALHEHPLQRAYVAGCLWLSTPEERAHANLRSALWRIHRVWPRLVETAGSQLQLGSDVSVDLREAEALAHRALIQGVPADLDIELLTGDLLPDWYDEWLLLERERFRQLRLCALEALCQRSTGAGRLNEALEAGLAAVAGEPLRESAHRALVGVHLAGGNIGEAVRQYRLCERLLREQLGVGVSAIMRELIGGIDALDTAR
jgi:DNA-binding SARP family transcriptional activator